MSSPGWVVERAVRASDLAPLTRLVLLVLASHIDDETGEIPEEYAPSFATLRAETGMSKAALAAHLTRAEEAGWLKREVPSRADSRRHHTKTTYTLTPPKLVREADQASSRGEQALVRDTDQASSPPVLELVREADQASSRGEHRSVDDVDRSDLEPGKAITAVQDGIAEATGRRVSRDWAAQVYRQHFNRPGVRDLRAYVASSIRRDPARFLPTISEPNGHLPVPRTAPVGERDNPANQTGAALARRLMADKAAN